MNSTELQGFFNVGDQVVYPLQGVGVIKARESRTTREYYRVNLGTSEMDVLLPVENASKMGLRHLTDAAATEAALLSLSKKKELRTSDWKERLNSMHDLMKEGSISSVATVVNCLYHRSKLKELPIQERKLYDNALSLLVDESSSVLGIDNEEVRKIIFRKLENI